LLHGKPEGHHLVTRLRLATALEPLRNASRWHEPGEESSYWISRIISGLDAWGSAAREYLQWMETLSQPPDGFLKALGADAVKLRRRMFHLVPSLLDLAEGGASTSAMEAILLRRSLPELRPETRTWLDQLGQEYEQARMRAAHSVKRLRDLAALAEQWASGIDMRFLYDRDRRLMGVGYAVGGPLPFTSHYDLLASESRLGSFVAIAKGDVPKEHWFTLARPRVAAPHGCQTLLSWSGTMFEYLMPLLFMRSYENSLLDHACREAIRQQMEYGAENGVPWGASESAYSALDASQTYQYRAFGVPGLALRPPREEDLVIAPYATMLALPLDPLAAIANLKKLETFQLSGPMGFYESIDFGLEKTSEGDRGVPVYTYMAHHQGMSLMALDEILHRDVMRRRFHAEVRVRAMEPLLFERIPITSPPVEEAVAPIALVRMGVKEESSERSWQEDTLIPRVHLQGNGRYSLLLTNSGGGYSRWNEMDVTRWRCDPALDCWGTYVYIRDVRSNAVWAAAHDPIPGETEVSSVRFSADRAEFHRRASGIDTILAVTVAPEDDVELRRLTITNRSLRSRELELTSYAELVLAPHRTDSAHPAFAKMFVETECLPGTIVAHRRPRSPEDSPVWAAHAWAGAGEEIQQETDRARFLGRGGTPGNPAMLRTPLSGSDGAVLDPIFSSRCRVTLQPRERREITLLIVAASSREEVLNLAAKYQRPEAVARAFEMAWTRAQLEFRYLGISPAAAHRFQELAGHLVFPNPRMRASPDRFPPKGPGQPTLWAYGISGDQPILSAPVSEARHLPLVRELLLAHTYWRLRGMRVDLVILNQESPSYDRPLEQQLRRLVEAHSVETGVDKPGGVFLRDWHAIPEEHRHLLLVASFVLLSGARGPLHQQLISPEERPGQRALFPSGASEEGALPLPFLELPYFNGLGGFTPDGREYAIYLKPGVCTPAPWANILANANFGTLVTESGLGFTWCGNSQTNRLTAWSNDPVSDPQSEIVYLRDDETGQAWTPVPLPIREKDAYRARHGQGYTVFEHNSHAIEQELTVFVPLDRDGNESEGAPLKICRLRLRNASSRVRRLTLFYFAEWVLGSVREDQLPHLRVSRDEASGALIATQSFSGAYSGHFAFLVASRDAASYSGDRAQFLGRGGSLEKPEALRRISLDNRAGAALDPAAVLQIPMSVAPGQTQDVIFLLGQAKTMEEVRQLVKHYRDGGNVNASLEATRRWWDSRVSAIQVKTPLLSVDFLLNRWLPYQALACRYWARSGFYQASGAFGFRDQLQDVMAIVYFAPELARQHILACAARQFIEGDVQHWWHPETGLGVRTRCSDDLAWLPYVVAHYVTVTGDTGVLDAPVAFLESEELRDQETERMFVPAVSAQTAPLWEHCRRALGRAWKLGPHDLPLFGSGDWNDGMNLVGRGGKGESVWLAWFLCHVSECFASVMERREPGAELARAWRERAARLVAAIERHSWDGEWYLRGFFDDGTPLGSHANAEAKIDSLAQSWAVISGAGEPDRVRRAMAAANRMLADDRHQLALLFTPPFDHSLPHPGYIMGYPPGMRENGGQYTHGSLWMAAAWARLGEPEAAVRLLTMMNPVEHGRDPERTERYRGEPYVTAGDVCAAPARIGQCGWTWYSGSAAWMYRIWLEDVLGFRLRGDMLTLAPAIPAHWGGFELRYRFRSATYAIAVRRHALEGAVLEVDGQVTKAAINLADDGASHTVTLWIPQNSTVQTTAAQPPVTAVPTGSLLSR
jgi:cyclic beta-1,2-glucan synthetase